MWIRFKGKVTGLRVEGDKSVPRTWSILIKPFLIKWFWKKVVVLEFPGPTGFRIGYKDVWGDTRFSEQDVGGRIRMLVGHEDVIFFGLMALPVYGSAETENTSFVPKLVVVTTKDDPQYADIPLL